MTEILLTKLQRPAPPPNRVDRPRLVQRLNEGLEMGHQLTLVSAPAGFGKTTCVSVWIETLELPSTWLSLDPADDDPGRFIRYLIAALQQVGENLGGETEGLLGSGQIPSPEVISVNLINELMAFANRFVLVLDDIHAIQDGVILDILERLISNPPPNLQLVMISRDDPPLPLARPRANNQLTEIRAQDLRFRSNETADFLSRMGEIELAEKDILALEKRTEGWIASLQLAMLAMKSQPDPSRFVREFKGSHTYVADYLLNEVLNNQPAKIRAFLVKTSILNRMNAALCAAVSGQSDSQGILNSLLRENMFIIPLDDEGYWFRYHHLFADLLSSQLHGSLSPKEIEELHVRAMTWHKKNGLTVEAVHHALAAEDFRKAAELIDQVAQSILFAGQVSTVSKWLQALPGGILQEQPRLRFFQVWADVLQERMDLDRPQVHETIKSISSLPSSPENDQLRGELLAVLSRTAVLSGEITEGISLAQEALQYIEQDELGSRARVNSALSIAYWFRSEEHKAVEAFRESIRCALAAGDLRLAGHTMFIHGLALENYGRLHEAADTFQSIIDLKSEPTAAYVESMADRKVFLPAGQGHVGLGSIHLEWCDLKAAEEHLKKGIELCRKGGFGGVFGGQVRMARLLQVKGDTEGASKVLRQLKWAEGRIDAFLITERQIRISLASGDEAGAVRQAKQLMPIAQRESDKLPPLMFLQIIQAVVVRVLVAQRRTEEAWALLEDLEKTAEETGNLARLVDVNLLKAISLLNASQQRVSSEALKCFEKAIALAEPEGIKLCFLEEGSLLMPLLEGVVRRPGADDAAKAYAKELIHSLRSFGRAEAVSAPGLVESMTPREMEVLQLLANGYTNKKIAEELVITVRTVKKHTSNIYGKLGVSNRTQAVARARELGVLLPD
jgi:LuxR family maltose regulon positive regulatory protein